MSREFTKEVSQLTKQMAEYTIRENVISPISSPFIPDREQVISILHDLRKLIFPRHFSQRELYNCTLDYYLGNLIVEIEQKLHKQIGIALMRDKDSNYYQVTQDVADEAAKLSVDFMKKIPDIHKMLMMDIQAFYEGDPAAQNRDEIILSYPGMYAIFVYRIAHELYKKKIPIIPRMMSEYAHSITGVDINPGAKIGKYFFIDHATGVVIGETCKIANHVKLYQGVTLGALSTEGGQSLNGVKRHPTIEDNVTIYSNATILGGDTVIGKGAVIGGSCFITKSIPAGATVQSEFNIKLNHNGKNKSE